MSILLVVWVVLMMFWLFFGCYIGLEGPKPALINNTIIPWMCVAILGYAVFSGVPVR
jgi:hypothetical protein